MKIFDFLHEEEENNWLQFNVETIEMESFAESRKKL